MDECLQWIGFANAAHCQAIRDKAGLDSITDFIDVTETNIRDMAESFAKHLPAQCFIFGMRRIKWLLGLMHWFQDQDRCSRPPTAVDVVDDDALKEVLNVSIRHAALCKVDDDQVETISKAADPGKYKDECNWADWEPAFTNYLSTIPGVYGIPLLYVIRENDDPQHDQDFGEDFTQEMISCASLRGANFCADSRKVHQLLKNYLVAESAEQWIHDIEHLNNGQCDMEALHNHYQGEGNASRRIATTEKLKETLHYKSECSLTFTTFLDRMQKMFNIFQEEGEELSENAKLQKLFKQVQHPQLQDTVKALKVRFDIKGLTYTQATNHLSAAVSKLAEYQMAHTVSAITRIRGGDNAPKDLDGIWMPNGTVYTGYYKNWNALSQEDKDKVLAERKKKGIDKSRNSNKEKGNKHKVAEIQALAESMEEMKCKISELTSKQQDDMGTTQGIITPPCNDAGNSFGGRRAKADTKNT